MAHTKDAINNVIHSINIDGVLYEIHDASAIHAIEDLNLSSVLKFGGVLQTRSDLPSLEEKIEDKYVTADGIVYHIVDEDTEVVSVTVNGVRHWEDFGHAIVTNHTHKVTITPSSTTSASKLETSGSVVAGTLPSYTEGTFNAGSFTQGEDKFTAGSFKPGSVTLNHTPCSYAQGTDKFTANVPTKIDTTKFNGGSLSYTAPSASFVQGEDKFNTNVPTKINVNAFNAGSASLTSGSYTAPSASFDQGEDKFTANVPTKINVNAFNAGSYTPPSLTECVLTQSVIGGVLSFTLTPGTFNAGSYTAPSLGADFYTAGSVATFEQGIDSHTFNAGSYAAPTLNYTAPSLGADFYTAGSAATFEQGEDSHTFNPGSANLTSASFDAGFYTAGSAATFEQGTDTFVQDSASITEVAAEWTAPTFEQGEDTYVAPSKGADTFNPGTHTQVTLPTFSTVAGLWNSTSETVDTGLPEGVEE